jgi:peptidoglycan-binding protein ArfA
LGLLAIPLVLGLDSNLTLPSVEPSPTLTAPRVNAPNVNAPNINSPNLSFAPLSIVRNGNCFTLSGDLPDINAKTLLLDNLRGAFEPTST